MQPRLLDDRHGFPKLQDDRLLCLVDDVNAGRHQDPTHNQERNEERRKSAAHLNHPLVESRQALAPLPAR